MHIRDILATGRPTLSFEFFPARQPVAAERLRATIAQLASHQPHFVSITYGAGGSTREFTYDLVRYVREETGLEPVPHLTCVGHCAEEISALLTRYAQLGVGNVLALRGDLPTQAESVPSDYPTAASLISAIRAHTPHPDTRGFGIGAACFPEGHPGTPNRWQEMDFLKRKVDAGVDYLCTQLFFDNHDFLDFRDRCALAGISVPILAGILPVTSWAGLEKICGLAAGARLPAKLQRALLKAKGEVAAERELGLQYTAEQCAELEREGVAGLHFYTLNQAETVETVLQRLGRRGPAAGD